MVEEDFWKEKKIRTSNYQNAVWRVQKSSLSPSEFNETSGKSEGFHLDFKNFLPQKMFSS